MWKVCRWQDKSFLGALPLVRLGLGIGRQLSLNIIFRFKPSFILCPRVV